MIVEDSKLLKTHFTVLPGEKTDPKLIMNLLQKIKDKQKEPFAKIFVTIHPMFFAPLLKAMEKEQFTFKNFGTDKSLFYIEF